MTENNPNPFKSSQVNLTDMVLDTIISKSLTPALDMDRCELPRSVSPTVRIGCPIPPPGVLHNTLFPGDFLIANQQKIAQGKIGKPGMVLELHYQTLDEFQSMTRAQWNEVRDFVVGMRRKGYTFMIHFPFLIQKGEGPFNMDYAWLTVPESMRAAATYVSRVNGSTNFAREVSLDLAKEFLQYADHINVPNITFHATKPGTFLLGQDFEDFSSKVGELAYHARRQDLCVKIAIETGGVTPSQLLRLNQEHGTGINLDTAHLFLDLDMQHPEWCFARINQEIVKFFEENHHIIPQLHFTQTTAAKDAHLPIHEAGVMECNKEIIQIMQEQLERKGKTFLAMVESFLSEQDQLMVYKAAHTPRYYGEGNSEVHILMGLPTAGKSHGAITLRPLIGQTLESDKVRTLIPGTMSQTRKVSQADRKRVYDELHFRLEERIKRGYPVCSIEATYGPMSWRHELFAKLDDLPSKGVYIWNFVRSEESCESRLDQRLAVKIERGDQFPPNILYDKNIYRMAFRETKPGEEPATAFSSSEIAHGPWNRLRGSVHIIEYDTSAQKITVFNPDDTCQRGVELLVARAKKEGWGEPQTEGIYTWDRIGLPKLS